MPDSRKNLNFPFLRSGPEFDTVSSQFARWQFIGALDIITELALFSISLYLVWGIQMSRNSKSLVVGAFGCRIPYA
jgi:hypothetical protein